MKKLPIVTCVLALGCVCVGLLAGCGEKNEEEKLVGKWVCTDFWGLSAADDTDYNEMILAEDGKLVLKSVKFNGNEAKMTGTWSLEGDQLSHSMKGQTVVNSIEFRGEELVLSYGKSKIKLVYRKMKPSEVLPVSDRKRAYVDKEIEKYLKILKNLKESEEKRRKLTVREAETGTPASDKIAASKAEKDFLKRQLSGLETELAKLRILRKELGPKVGTPAEATPRKGLSTKEEMLVGKWESLKFLDGSNVDKGDFLKVTFSKDAKLTLRIKNADIYSNDRYQVEATGSWSIVGEQLKISLDKKTELLNGAVVLDASLSSGVLVLRNKNKEIYVVLSETLR